MNLRSGSDDACLIRHVSGLGDADGRITMDECDHSCTRHLMYHSILRDTIPMYKNKGHSCICR